MDHFNGELLVKEVEKYPCLYNTKCEDYKNRALKAEAWVNVCREVLGEENWSSLSRDDQSSLEGEVQKRWKNMRDAYFRSLKDCYQVDKSGKKKWKKPYRYHKQMSFLQDFMETRTTPGSTSGILLPVADCSLEVAELDDLSTSSAVAVARKRKQQQHDPIERDFTTYFSTDVPSFPEKNDPEEMFLLSLLPYVKEMSTQDKLDFKIKTLQLIQSYK